MLCKATASAPSRAVPLGGVATGSHVGPDAVGDARLFCVYYKAHTVRTGILVLSNG